MRQARQIAREENRIRKSGNRAVLRESRRRLLAGAACFIARTCDPLLDYLQGRSFLESGETALRATDQAHQIPSRAGIA